MFGDDLHEGGAHDDACGARFERAPDVLGRGDAKAEQGGRGLGPLEVADDALCGRARGVVGAGDADAREQIGVSARESRDSCDALVGGVGRDDGDEVQARLAGGLVPFGLGLAHARREVGNEHGVCARVGCGLHEAPDVGRRDEVDVKHEADGRLGMCGPEPAQYVEAACGRGAVGEGPVGGGLDDGAVGARVGERDPEL